MIDAVKQYGGELGYLSGADQRDILERQFERVITDHKEGKADDSQTLGALSAIAAMALGALERATEKSKDPLDHLHHHRELRSVPDGDAA